MDSANLFRNHLEERQRRLADDLGATGFDGLVISSGAPMTYFADDNDAPFHTTPHFAHWCPVPGAHHLLELRPGTRPRLIRWAPADYWYEPSGLGDPFWLASFDVVEASTADKVWEALGKPSRAAYIGNEATRAESLGISVNPEPLTARLDWWRGYKTAYEIDCIEYATKRAAKGFAAVEQAFHAGGSELEIHHAYVAAAGITDDQLPYTSIVALDEKGAFLHYHGKRTARNGRVLLIDAGAAHNGYAADITRTYTRGGCDPRFVELVEGLNEIQLELCNAVGPGLPFGDLHHRTHVAIAGLLARAGLYDAGAEEAVERGFSRAFFPHGLGHHLGLQVHDVGGQQADVDGTPAPPPDQHPYLRNTRTLEPGHCVTIEPGIYFIGMLLEPLRKGDDAARFDWELIDALSPLGGIRIEDNLVVTENGHRNLTKPHLPH